MLLDFSRHMNILLTFDQCQFDIARLTAEPAHIRYGAINIFPGNIQQHRLYFIAFDRVLIQLQIPAFIAIEINQSGKVQAIFQVTRRSNIRIQTWRQEILYDLRNALVLGINPVQTPSQIPADPVFPAYCPGKANCTFHQLTIQIGNIQLIDQIGIHHRTILALRNIFPNQVSLDVQVQTLDIAIKLGNTVFGKQFLFGQNRPVVIFEL